MKIDFNVFAWGSPLAGLIFSFAPTLAIAQSQTHLPTVFSIHHPTHSPTHSPTNGPTNGSARTRLIHQTLAQADPIYAPEGCRITRERLGVYREPNTSEEATGILAKDVTVLLGSGSGDGWARIVSPRTGWVQGKFLRGGANTPCPAALRPPVPTPLTPSPPAPPTSRVVRAVCEVIPEEGLIVRDTPVVAASRVIGQIRPGSHTFQFSNQRQETETPEGLRQWVYITAPAKGWISTGFTNGGSNLSGENCR
ncbi:MAG: SH3 domain-containing protein [Synechococcales cyanobacterium CRU_2_2]|nr:SH3 domain-containing protein [Synechococcales cyanobacterium CRU_2_2]